MRAAAVVLGLLVLLPASAGAYIRVSLSGDMDGDPRRERVRTVAVTDPEFPDYERTEVRISDECEGRRVDLKVAGPQDNPGRLRLVEADTRPGKEAFIDLRSGASGRVGEARVVAWRAADGAACPSPRQLFRYTRPTRRPRGASGYASFGAAVREVSRRSAGREVVLDEFFTAGRDPSCCPSFRKRTLHRYDSARDRYVRYRSTVTRVRRGR